MEQKFTLKGQRSIETKTRDAEVEAVSWVSRFRIRGWDSYQWNNYILVEAEAEARKRGIGAAEAALTSTAYF